MPVCLRMTEQQVSRQDKLETETALVKPQRLDLNDSC